MVVRGGFEPPKLARQIYSLIPLATREPLLDRIKFLTLLTLEKMELVDGIEPPTYALQVRCSTN